jgi:hypothetical protein
MNLYYANGGGLGHLTRANAFLRQLKIENETAILTASKFAEDKRIVGDIEIIKVDDDLSQQRKKYRDFLQKVLSDLLPEKIFLDSFPAGIIGEFTDFDFGKTEVSYIARLLKWRNYSYCLIGKPPQFKKTFVLEMLEKEHQIFIENHSDEITGLELHYPHPEKQNEDFIKQIVKKHNPFWLIVHAGNIEETGELWKFAEEIKEIEKAEVELVLISPNPFPNKICFDIYPASLLFPFAKRIFTAGGFNAVQQTKDLRSKHFVMPFERRYDDQFARAERLNNFARKLGI